MPASMLAAHRRARESCRFSLNPPPKEGAKETNSMTDKPIAVVTGASSGIGASTAEALAKAGFHVVVGARRLDRLQELAARIDGSAVALDATDMASIEAFVARTPECA